MLSVAVSAKIPQCVSLVLKDTSSISLEGVRKQLIPVLKESMESVLGVMLGTSFTVVSASPILLVVSRIWVRIARNADSTMSSRMANALNRKRWA